MATGGIPNVFECAICLNNMLDRNPRCLPCVHTFCEDCLLPLLKDSQIICPSCRKPTRLESNDITEVPINFILCQMKEFASIKIDDYFTDPGEKSCEICRKGSAIFICETCPRLFCAKCKKGHSKIKKYEGHCVYEICLKHGDTVGQMCKVCLDPLCQTCVSEHQQHQENIEEFHTVLKELNDDVNTIKDDISTSEKEYDQTFNKVAKKASVNQRLLEDLRKRRNLLARMITEADKCIQITEDNQAAYKEIELEYEKHRFYCEELKLGLEAMEEKSSNFKKFPALKQEAEETLKFLKKDLNSEFNLPPFVLCQEFPFKFIVPRIPEKIKALKKVKSLSGICEAGNVKYSGDIAAFGDDILAIVAQTPVHIVQVNQNGEVKDRYYPEMKDKPITGIDVYEEEIYIAQSNVITVVTKNKHHTTRTYKPRINNMNKILVMNENNLIITEDTNPGRVYWYNMMNESLETVIQKVEYPAYVNAVYTEDGPRYIVSDRSGDCVRVYSPNWNLLHTIGEGTRGSSDGQFNWPFATTVTEQNTILVADSDNHRICHFTLDGVFLSHIITKQDGLNKPTGLLYKNNVLWVSGRNSGDIKRFQLQYQ